jgi:hypothetical protein
MEPEDPWPCWWKHTIELYPKSFHSGPAFTLCIFKTNIVNIFWVADNFEKFIFLADMHESVEKYGNWNNEITCSFAPNVLKTFPIYCFGKSIVQELWII